MRPRTLLAVLVGVLVALCALDARAQCTATSSTPVFPTPGGSVFGWQSSQWGAYLGAKADANNGNLCGPRITNLPNPVNQGDAVNLATLNASLVNPSQPHTPVAVATAAPLPNSPIYANGSGPPFASKITSSSNTPLVVDGAIFSTIGTRVLVSQQANAAWNGIYTLTGVGVTSVSPWVLTRATDFNVAVAGGIAFGAVVFVNSSGGGSTLGGTTWTMSTNGAIIVGVTPINFIQTSASTSLTPNAGNFAATPIYGGTVSSALFAGVLGSSGVPVVTENAAMIIQKVTTGAQSGTAPNGAVYFSNTKTGSAVGDRATGVLGEAYDVAGGNGTFVEGGRFHGTLSAGAVAGQAGGIVAVAQNIGGSAWDYLIGTESAVENSTTDAPGAPLFNQNHIATNFEATIQNSASKAVDASFMVNPFNVRPARVGFLVPPGTEVSDSAFRSAGTTVYGLDLSHAITTGAAIMLPNNQFLGARGVGDLDLNLLYVPFGSNALILGTSTQGITIPTTTVPAPGPGFFSIYVDSSDGKLKAKGGSGTVTILAVP